MNADDDQPAVRPRRRRVLIAVIAIVVIVVLAGSALVGVLGIGQAQPAPSASPSASASGTPRPADPALVPAYPEQFTSDAAGTETTRLGDEIVGLVDPAAVLNDDEVAQEVPVTADAPAYFGVLHTLTLDPSVDPAAQVEEIVARLSESGWAGRDAVEQDGFTQVVMVSGTDSATSWLAVIGADASVPGQSVLSVQLASPNLP